jgi:hypothetical protein
VISLSRKPHQPSRFSKSGYKGYKASVKLVRDGIEEYDPVKLSNSGDVYEFMHDLEDNDRECFYSIHLDSKYKVMSCEETFKGGFLILKYRLTKESLSRNKEG